MRSNQRRAKLLDELALKMAERETLRDKQRELSKELNQLAVEFSKFDASELVEKAISGRSEQLRTDLKHIPAKLKRATLLDTEIQKLSKELEDNFNLQILASFKRQQA